MGIFLGLGIKLLEPLVRGGQHLVTRVFPSLYTGAVPDAVDRMLQQIEQFFD